MFLPRKTELESLPGDLTVYKINKGQKNRLSNTAGVQSAKSGKQENHLIYSTK